MTEIEYMPMGLDRFDRMLIMELARNARLSNVELGERVGLSSSAVARRIKVLEDDGLIIGYHAEFNLKRLGFGAMVMVRIRLENQATETMDAFEKAVAATPAIVQCLLVSGSDDYLITVLAKDVADYEQVLRTQLAGLPRVAHVHSDFAIRGILSKSLPDQTPVSGARNNVRATPAKPGRQAGGAK